MTNPCDAVPATHTKKAQAHTGNNRAVLSPLVKSLLTFSKSDLPEHEPGTIHAFICGHNLLAFFCTRYVHVIACCWQWQLGVSCYIDNTRKSNLKARRIHKATHHGNVEAEVTSCPSNRPIPLKSFIGHSQLCRSNDHYPTLHRVWQLKLFKELNFFLS